MRSLLSLLALGCVAVGCGATAATSTVSPVAYSECMRAHGVPNFPDPDPKGNVLIPPDARIDPSSPRYRSAQKRCGKLQLAAAGGRMTPAQQAKALAQLTRYAQCMRAHGIPMADPFKGPEGGVGYSLPRGTDLSSPTYTKAAAACKRLLPH